MRPYKPYIFINPPSSRNRKIIRTFDCATESKGNYLFQPYDFLLLSSHFECDEFSMIDAVADRIAKVDLLESITHARLFVVALADTNWDEDFQFVKDLRSKFTDVPIFVFGDSFIDPIAQDEIRPYVNGILHNPMDVDLKRDVVATPHEWIEDKGFVTKTTYKSKGLKAPRRVAIATPKHDRFLHESYRWPFARHRAYTTVFTAWGCPYACAYCVVAKFPNLYRDHTEVIEELKYVHSLGLKEIYIGDRSFGLPRNNAVTLLKQMIAHQFGFHWSTYFHPNQYDEELLALMKQAGCHTIIIGIETHNLQSLKQYGRNIRSERLLQLIQCAKKLRMHICGDFLIGLPNEGVEDILKTIHMSKTIGIDYASFNIATPLAGSTLRDNAKMDGRIRPGGEKHFDSFGYTKVLSNGILTAREIVYWRNKAVRSFYLRPSYLFSSLRRISSFEHLIIQIQEMFQILKKSH